MADLRRRIDRLEELIGATECICGGAGRESGLVVIDPDWNAEQIREVEDGAGFECPTHGPQRPKILRISPTDARL